MIEDKNEHKKSLSTPKKKDDKKQSQSVCASQKKLREEESSANIYIQSITQEDISVYKLFKQKNYSAIKERLQTKLNLEAIFEGQTFYSYFEFKEFLIRSPEINMWDILELPEKDSKEQFQDVLNDYDKTKKAYTSRSFEKETKGIEYYDSLDTNFKGHLIKVVGDLIKEKEKESTRILATVFGIEIKEPLEVTEIKNGAEFMVSILRSSDLSIKMPNFYKIFGNYIEETACLIETISNQDNFYSAKYKEYRIYSYISTNGYSKIYKKYYSGFNKGKLTMSKHISACVLSGLIFKIKKEAIPFDILRIIENYRIEKQYSNRTDVLTLPLFTEEYLIVVEEKSKLMVDKKFARRNLSKDMVVADYGIDLACEVYSQLKENEKTLSKKSINLINQSVKIINKQINKKGYILESKLLERLFINNYKENKNLKKTYLKEQLGRVTNIICLDNDYSRVSLTKALRLELNITEKEIPLTKRPLIYIKNN